MPTTLDVIFPGQSEMARRMREHDWSRTTLGAPEQWPPHLRSSLSLCLTSRLPIVMYWGDDFNVLYNDPYISFLGPDKHPRFLGAPGRECWREIWSTIGPMLRGVVQTGEATWSEDLLMYFARRQPAEEVYVRFSFGPILAPDGSGVDGIFCPCTETTERVIGERRLDVLRRLGQRRSGAREASDVALGALDALASNPQDLPFAAIYLRAPGDPTAHRVGCTGLDESRESLLPDRLPFEAAAAHPTELGLPLAALADARPVQQALQIPIPGASRDDVLGVLVSGVSAHLVLDDDYRSFFDLVAASIGGALVEAQAYETERNRAEALEAIDQAKTTFFTNISHEFRTPLTLMLGPLEEAHASLEGRPEQPIVASARRNAERLLKLVNTLLEFARVEGGRASAVFEATDLSASTAELASSFRSACEKAGVALVVDCPPLPEDVYVDRDHWEKIVLNLVSNAFKFTLEGSITVSVRSSADGALAQLLVRDTGSGIPAEEMPKLFGRFQRIEGVRGRSFEGSGIGLALTQELVKLHGGSIAAESIEWGGTVFTVSVPFGTAHLPPGKVRQARQALQRSSQAGAFIGEAMQWLTVSSQVAPDDSGFGKLDEACGSDRQPALDAPRILLADDNADLRAYLQRLLAPHYAVTVAVDGEEALAQALAHPPDLVLADVMMPVLDGIGLLAQLRGDPRTRTVPIVLLSARAGEEARVEGLAAGADDYLVKPFSARELLAKVAAQLAMVRLRRDADAARLDSEQLLRTALAASGAGTWALDLKTEQAQWSPEVYDLLGIDASVSASTGAGMPHVHPEDARDLLTRRNDQLSRTGRIDLEFRIQHPVRGLRWAHLLGSEVAGHRVLGIAMDVTDRKAAELALIESAQQLRAALGLARLGQFRLDLPGFQLHSSAQCKANFGLGDDEDLGFERLMQLIHPNDRERVDRALRTAIDDHSDYDVEYRTVWPVDGTTHLIAARGRCVYHADGVPQRLVGVTQDITERQRAQEKLLLITDSVPGLISYIDRQLRYRFNNKAYEDWFGVSRELVAGRHVRDVLGDASFAALRPRMEAALAGQASHFEAEVPYLHGGTRFIHADYIPDVQTDGSVAGLYVFVTDITQRKRAETALVEARNAMAAQVRDLTLLHDITSRLTADRELQPMLEELVHAAVMLTHAPQAKLTVVSSADSDLELVASTGLGKPYLERVAREPRAAAASSACLERRQRVIVEDVETDPMYLPYRENARIGGYRSAHATPLLARDGTVIGVLTLFKPGVGSPDKREIQLVDLLARHAASAVEHLKMQQALRLSEQRFKSMADTAPAMLWMTDRDNKLTYISRGWHSYTGQSQEESYGDGFGWLQMTHEDDREAAGRAFFDAASSRRAFELEYRLRRADGSWRWVLDAGQPRFGDDGAWIGYIGSVIDMHDAVVSREALRDADRRKDEFLATLAHELRNPLAPIRNALHLFNLAGDRVPTQGVREMLERQVNHMVRLVDDLMEASRISRGELQLQRSTVELDEVLRTALEASKPLIDRARHRLKLIQAGQVLLVDGDPVRLAQIFANLLNNAAKYTDEGGGIEVNARRDGDWAVVDVRDSGIGLSAEQIPRLFEMFAQFDAGSGRSSGGLGIGLALAQRLAQMHGGSVAAESEGPGFGSRFTVRLPLARTPMARPVHGDGDTKLSLEARRLLVVDDNRDAADSLGMLLRFLGAEVRVVHDGASALVAAADWRPAVALLDLGMPMMDGWEVARRLRSDAALRDLKLVALTGWGQEKDRERTAAAGFDHHLVKPVDINVLQRLLASIQTTAADRDPTQP